MKPGDIVLVALSQADGQIKRRPSVLIKKMPGHGDWLVCGISTQLHQFIKDFDEMLDQHHPDFRSSRLLAPSVVRLGFLTTVPSSTIPRIIGNLSSATVKKLIGNLAWYLTA